MNFSALGDLLKSGESWLIERLFAYAKQTGFIEHAPPMPDVWHCSINGLTRQICLGTDLYENIPELGWEEDYTRDCLASFGIIEAQRHRARGVSLSRFLAWIKYYRQTYLDYIRERVTDDETREAYGLFINRCFDRIELGFIREWEDRKSPEITEELRASNLTLSSEKNRYRMIYENFPHPVFLLNETSDIINLNKAARELLSEGILSGSTDCTGPFSSPFFAWLRSLSLNAIRNDLPLLLEKTLCTRKGERCFSVYGAKSFDLSENQTFYILSLSDITGRKTTEKRFFRLARIYDVLSHTNQAIVRHTTIESLFKEICDIAIKNGRLKMAAVNHVHPQTKKPETVAFSGASPALSPFAMSGSVKPNITDIVIKTERPYICNNIKTDPALHSRADDAKKNDLQALSCFPVFCRRHLFGTLNLYAEQKDFFQPDIVAVFEEMAKDISFALDNFEREKQRQRAEQELWETNNKLHALYKATPLPVVAHTLDGKVLMWNPEAEKVLGWKEKETLDRLVPSLPEEGIAEFLEKNERVFAGESVSQLEVQRYTKDGRCRDFLLFNTPLYDSSDEVYAIMAVLMDITDQKKDQERIAYLAHHDHLTGLPNRFFLKEHFAHQASFAMRSKTSLALCALDLDGFKFINDMLGHPLGDALLCQVSKELQNIVRGTDLVCRMGGDEFLLLLGGFEKPSDLVAVFKKIFKIFATPFVVDGHQAHMSISMGVALFGEDGEDFDSLFKRADAAMYHAKESGGNNIKFYQQEIGDRIEKRFLIEKELRKALSGDVLTMHYQPICRVGDNAIIGAEALIRWKHPRWGFVPPDQFIPIAEEKNLINPLGEWILEEVCRTVQKWDRKGVPPIAVAVNISAKQIFDPTFHDVLAKVLKKYDLEPQRFVLEVTESLFLENLPSVETIMQKLKTIGVGLALDDFGMGYSSLSYLKRFRIDHLKIDKSFIRDICQDDQDAVLTKTIVEMGRNLGLQTIAEGVETKEQLALIRAYRCGYYQGFLCSKPLSGNDFIKLLQQRYPREGEAGERTFFADNVSGS